GRREERLAGGSAGALYQLPALDVNNAQKAARLAALSFCSGCAGHLLDRFSRDLRSAEFRCPLQQHGSEAAESYGSSDRDRYNGARLHLSGFWLARDRGGRRLLLVAA